MPDEAGERAARARAEERAWREIVDHYGERSPLPHETAPDPATQGEPFHIELDDESFTPPPLPPPPVVSPERRVAWVGLVASPVLLVLINVIDYALPGILTGALVVAFIASFGYLVATMAPRDPDDDGARV
jgi:hypothetical protein